MIVPFDDDLAQMGWIYPEFVEEKVLGDCNCARSIEPPFLKAKFYTEDQLDHPETTFIDRQYREFQQLKMRLTHMPYCYKTIPVLVWHESDNIPRILSRAPQYNHSDCEWTNIYRMGDPNPRRIVKATNGTRSSGPW